MIELDDFGYPITESNVGDYGDLLAVCFWEQVCEISFEKRKYTMPYAWRLRKIFRETQY